MQLQAKALSKNVDRNKFNIKEDSLIEVIGHFI